MTVRVLGAFLALAAAASGAAPARRIVSTTPSITEMLYAVGLGDQVVGVTTYCRYPAAAKAKPKVGTYTEPNIEAIVSLRPDLVVIQSNPIQLRAKLERVGLRVLEVGHDNIEQVYTSMQKIGDAGGVSARAAEVVRRLRSEIEAVRSRVAGRPPQTAMFVIGRAPNRIQDLVVVGRATYLNELISVSGGINAFRDALAPYPKVGWEEILARNPAVIIDMGQMAETAGVTEEQKHAVVRLWQAYKSLAAVKNGRVFAVASDVFVVPGPRMVEAARAFAAMFHPESAR